MDLIGVAETDQSPFGLPEAQHLYPPLPEQLGDESSFASQVADIITARKRFRISDADVHAAPDLQSQATFALVMTLPDEVGGVAVTAANYSRQQESVTIDLDATIDDLEDLSGSFPVDILDEAGDQQQGGAPTLDANMLTIPLGPLSARTVVIDAEAVSVDD